MKLEKGSTVVIPPHIARDYLGNLQKIDKNTYTVKKTMEVRSSSEICLLSLPGEGAEKSVPEKKPPKPKSSQKPKDKP